MIAHTTEDFWECFDKLPVPIQASAERAYELWRRDHWHPGLHFKPIRQSVYSVRVTAGYRALGVYDNETDIITWFWIGEHRTYEKMLRRLKKVTPDIDSQDEPD